MQGRQHQPTAEPVVAPPPKKPASSTVGASWLQLATTPPKPAATMDAAKAFAIVRAVYGHHRQLTPGKVVFVDSSRELLARADEHYVRIKAPVLEEKRLWKPGDAETRIGESGQGFTDSESHTAYVPKQGVLPETTVHEMLHLNESDQFRSSVGSFLSEGVTQVLALRALRMTGFEVPEDQAYVENVEIVRALSLAVGPWIVEQSYFCGPEPLIAALQRIGKVPSDAPGYARLYHERAAFRFFLDLLRSPDGLDAAKAFLRPAGAAERGSVEVEQRLRVIRSHLDTLWISDADVDAVVGVLRSCPNEAVLDALAVEVRPLLSRMRSESQRNRILHEL
jgi:hypothetical protein